jgi:hypothetical protein
MSEVWWQRDSARWSLEALRQSVSYPLPPVSAPFRLRFPFSGQLLDSPGER